MLRRDPIRRNDNGEVPGNCRSNDSLGAGFADRKISAPADMARAPGRAQGRSLARNCYRSSLCLGRRRLVLLAPVRERRPGDQHRPDRQQSKNARSHGRILAIRLSSGDGNGDGAYRFDRRSARTSISRSSQVSTRVSCAFSSMGRLPFEPVSNVENH